MSCCTTSYLKPLYIEFENVMLWHPPVVVLKTKCVSIYLFMYILNLFIKLGKHLLPKMLFLLTGHSHYQQQIAGPVTAAIHWQLRLCIVSHTPCCVRQSQKDPVDPTGKLRKAQLDADMVWQRSATLADHSNQVSLLPNMNDKLTTLLNVEGGANSCLVIA